MPRRNLLGMVAMFAALVGGASIATKVCSKLWTPTGRAIVISM